MRRVPRPSRRLFLLLSAGVPWALLAALSGIFARIAWCLDAVVALLAVADLFLAWRETLQSHIDAPAKASRNVPFDVVVTMHNRARRHLGLRLDMHNPARITPAGVSRICRIEAGGTHAERFTLTPAQRGVYVCRAPVVTYKTPLGLWHMALWPQDKATVDVLPSTRDPGRFDMLVRQQKLHQMGVARARQRGTGSEIAGLRPYAQGDPLARVDWKATARKGALISREMHAERRQTLVLMLDCGRRMAREVDGRSRLDDAVEAALLLGHVALRSDDRVGLLAFSDTVLSVVPPVRGYESAGVLARAMFNLTPVLREPAYEAMAGRVHASFSRRSLMVLFTDAVEPESLASLAKPVRFLSARHLVLCVTFRDASVARAIDRAGDTTESFYRAGAAADVWVERERNLALLRRAGAMVLEAEAGHLSTEVINRYLDIKARRLL